MKLLEARAIIEKRLSDLELDLKKAEKDPFKYPTKKDIENLIYINTMFLCAVDRAESGYPVNLHKLPSDGTDEESRIN